MGGDSPKLAETMLPWPWLAPDSGIENHPPGRSKIILGQAGSKIESKTKGHKIPLYVNEYIGQIVAYRGL